MSKWPQLTQAPIVEGLIDLRVQCPSIDFKILQSACAELASEFPSQEEIRTFTGQVSFSPEVGASASAQTAGPIGLMLRSANEKWVAQFRLDGFTLSRLQPYSSWNELNDRAKELWSRYASVMKPNKIGRVAARFINRIPLPMSEPFDKTFVTTFTIAESLPQTVANFLLRVVIPFEDKQSFAIVTQSLSENNQDCIFDIDAFAQYPEGISEVDAWAKIQQLRLIKNQLFFDSLTPNAIEKFK